MRTEKSSARPISEGADACSIHTFSAAGPVGSKCLANAVQLPSRLPCAVCCRYNGLRTPQHGSHCVVVGHTRRETYCEARGEAYRRGAERAGHTATLFVTSHMTFDLVLHVGVKEVQPLEPDLHAAHEAIIEADHLVFIFPLWLGTLPAILKGFLERVLQPELVDAARRHKCAKLLKGKTARVIVTMSMPKLVYRWYCGAYAVKMQRRNILNFMGISSVTTTILGNFEGAGAQHRLTWNKRGVEGRPV